MSLEVTSLFDLDEAAVAASRETLAQLLQEMHPDLYLRRGVIYDYVLHPASMFQQHSALFWDRVRRSQSLYAIDQDPELADEEIVNEVASNYYLSRLPGQTAYGSFTLVLAELSPVTVPAGAEFTSQGQRFITEATFTARDVAALVQQSTDRLLVPQGDGTYAFVIDVVAQVEGEASRLRKNSVVVPDDLPPNFVKSYVTNDFLGGYSAESNTSLINRLLPGVAARALSGPVNMTALLTHDTRFERVVADSVIGMGKPELVRDKHSIFPGTTGGKCDWYIKSQELPQHVLLTKTATLVEKTYDGYGVWQFSLGRDDAPGFYDVTEIVRPDTQAHLGGFTIQSDVRGMDLSPLDNDGFLPDIANALEARYTRFQTATIRFKDTETPTADLTAFSSTQSYAVTVRALPLLAEIQDMVVDPATRNPMGDCLVRAAVPCFVKLSFTIYLVPGQATPDLGAIAAELSGAVNRTGFTGLLPASVVSEIVQGYLTGGAYADTIDILGRLQHPDGTWRSLRSTDRLEIPEEPELGSTPRTAVFFLDPTDVTIAVRVDSRLAN